MFISNLVVHVSLFHVHQSSRPATASNSMREMSKKYEYDRQAVSGVVHIMNENEELLRAMHELREKNAGILSSKASVLVVSIVCQSIFDLNHPL